MKKQEIVLKRIHIFLLDITLFFSQVPSFPPQSDDLDGEIDLTACVNVQDCDVEKNYGFQIQVCAFRCFFLVLLYADIHTKPAHTHANTHYSPCEFLNFLPVCKTSGGCCF